MRLQVPSGRDVDWRLAVSEIGELRRPEELDGGEEGTLGRGPCCSAWASKICQSTVALKTLCLLESHLNLEVRVVEHRVRCR